MISSPAPSSAILDAQQGPVVALVCFSSLRCNKSRPKSCIFLGSSLTKTFFFCGFCEFSDVPLERLQREFTSPAAHYSLGVGLSRVLRMSRLGNPVPRSRRANVVCFNVSTGIDWG